MGYRLAQSDLTLDDTEGSKTKITDFDVKYVDNGQSYDTGPNEHDCRSHIQQHPGPLPEIFGLVVLNRSQLQSHKVCCKVFCVLKLPAGKLQSSQSAIK